MKVVILGGYGVFGGRLARLLIRDGHDVIVAGRDRRRAAAFVEEYGGTSLSLDLQQDLSPILKLAPDVVVDAAGPFQAYETSSDRYRVVRFCIDNGIHYLDLSDDSDFTAGITALDDRAVQAGTFALSGVSSVPAISAAAVSDLSSGFSEIILIETVILPGNRAPRGQSVVASILHQAGAPLMMWRGGAWRRYTGWTDARKVELAPDLKRWASLIGAPDLRLFPTAFQARSVLFRAGLELSVMHWGLAVLAWLRRKGWLPSLFFASLYLWRIAKLLERFGGDRGGMIVEVVGVADGRTLRRRWQLVAEEGSGPFVPAIPALALLRKGTAQPGARPCIHDLSLGDVEAAMTGLPIHFQRTEAVAPSFFEQILRERWQQLPASVRRLHSVHDVESFSGTATVTRGSGLLARFAAWFFRFPKAGQGVPLTITKYRTATGEIWERNFAGRVFRSYLTSSNRAFHYRERFFAFNYEQELPVFDHSLHLPVRRGWFLGIPMPEPLLPESRSREYDIDGVFHFDVGLYAPLGGGLIVRYQGSATPDSSA